ncbi:MAG: SGNH/GDSL hydrolase family protein [Lachnospiraceae bacterium]|nr:SGNH/GDSL hydrolase family protein [Lachnospiraceae bacterium]
MRGNSYISNFKIILALVIVIAVTGAVGNLVGKKYADAASLNTINAFTAQRFDDFYSLPKDSIDMVFIGSSHSYCSFDPANFNVPSFQMGTPLQHPDTSYYSLLEVLDNQDPETVVVEIYWDMLDDNFELKQATSLFEVIRNEKRIEDYIENVFPDGDKVKYENDVIRFQQDFFAYASSRIVNKVKNTFGVTDEANPSSAGDGVEYYLADGYVYCDIVIPETEFDETNQFKNLDGKDWEFSNTQKRWLEKIIELCEKKDKDLVFVTAPVANVSMGYIKNYEAINEEISSFAEEKGVPYIDYNIINMEEGMFTHDNFRDDAHLNDSGVKILDAHFEGWLNEVLG